jgi:hypothetical protein
MLLPRHMRTLQAVVQRVACLGRQCTGLGACVLHVEWCTGNGRPVHFMLVVVVSSAHWVPWASLHGHGDQVRCQQMLAADSSFCWSMHGEQQLASQAARQVVSAHHPLKPSHVGWMHCISAA